MGARRLQRGVQVGEVQVGGFLPVRGYLRRTRDFVDDEVLPVINGYWERAEFPWPLIEKLAKLEVVATGSKGTAARR